MSYPKMIVFDYGQTLVDEACFNGICGTEAVLEKCVKNPKNITAKEVQQLADEINQEIGRFEPVTSNLPLTEIHNHPFQNYLYDYFGLERIVSPLELESIFWDAAAPGKSTKNIEYFLDCLKKKEIRTAVISNISFSGQALKNRINNLLPENSFEFILASSEYVFRKPHERIFEVALSLADLKAADIWYCGDNGVCDIDGAKRAGLTPVWYKGASEKCDITPKEECTIIYDWLELIEILEIAE